jgi:hypothetical protein
MLDGRNQSSNNGDYGNNTQIGYDNNSNFGMGGGDASKKMPAHSFAHELDDDIPF